MSYRNGPFTTPLQKTSRLIFLWLGLDTCWDQWRIIKYRKNKTIQILLLGNTLNKESFLFLKKIITFAKFDQSWKEEF